MKMKNNKIGTWMTQKGFRGHVILTKCLARDIVAALRRSRPDYSFRACHHSTRINSIRVAPLMSTAKDLYIDRRDCEAALPLPPRSTTHLHTNCIKTKCPRRSRNPTRRRRPIPKYRCSGNANWTMTPTTTMHFKILPSRAATRTNDRRRIGNDHRTK